MPTPEQFAAAVADRYRIERELGQGGMATVYLAHDLKHDRDVAIKVLKPELAAVLGAERFVTEIKTTAALQHPNILPLFDSGEAGGFLFYVMPYVEGETLRTKLDRETQLGIDESVQLIREVADALQYAHEHGVVHRDIKPENILLHAGRPMVADFGIALAVSAAAGGRMTETGLSLGTPHYMSPEQATAEKTITNRSDIYSLGAVLYEMLTGEPPHTGTSAQQIIMKIVTDDVAPVTKIRKTVPPNVAAAVGEALEKLPADRFDSAKAFAEALANPHFTALGAGTDGAPISGGGGFGWWIRRPWSWAALAVAVMLAAALVHSARRPLPAAPSFHPLTFGGGKIFNARFAPDGQAVVYSSTSDTGTVPRLYLIRPDQPDPVALGPDSVQLLNVSRDGELAVLTHAECGESHRLCSGTLATMTLAGAAPRELESGVYEADWLPDGKQLAVTRLLHGDFQLEYPRGTVIARTAGYFSDVHVSPSGDAIAYFDHPGRFDDRGRVVIVDRAGHPVAQSEPYWGLEGLAWRPDGRGILFSAGTKFSGADLSVHSLDRSSDDRVVLSGAGDLTVQDLSLDGRALVTDDEEHTSLVGRAPGASRDADLGVHEFPDTPVLSGDGHALAFSDEGVLGGANYTVIFRKMDGSPPISLGEGWPLAVSTNGGLVFIAVDLTPERLLLAPTGPGATQRIDHGQFASATSAGGLQVVGRDTIMLFCAAEPSQSTRCYVQAGVSGTPRAVTPNGSSEAVLSPDAMRVIATVGDSAMLFSANGSAPPQVVRGFRSTDRLLRWSPDGRQLWVVATPETEVARIGIDAIDLGTGSRRELETIVPRDLGGVRDLAFVQLADDPRVYAYTKFTYTSRLFSVEGLKE